VSPSLESRSFELGLGVQSDKQPAEYEAIARRAEAAGVDVVTVYHDLLFQPAIAPLLLMARVTERIRLGPSALNPYTLHPVELAGQAAALDLASGGRAYLGLVQGAWLDQLALDGRQSLGALREAVEVVRRLLAGERSGFSGRHFTLAPGAGLNYEPLRPEIPLLIGSWRPRTLAWAGTVAREVKLGGTANPDMIRQARAWIGNDDVRIVVGAVTVVDEDGERARARARQEVQLYLPVVARLDPTLELAEGEEPPLELFTIAGTPEEVAARVLELVDAGAGRVELGTPQGLTTGGGVELICDRVLPLLG
jgi:5,10-methylenetetrahydromethanopterin reductase